MSDHPPELFWTGRLDYFIVAIDQIDGLWGVPNDIQVLEGFCAIVRPGSTTSASILTQRAIVKVKDGKRFSIFRVLRIEVLHLLVGFGFVQAVVSVSDHVGLARNRPLTRRRTYLIVCDSASPLRAFSWIRPGSSKSLSAISNVLFRRVVWI